MNELNEFTAAVLKVYDGYNFGEVYKLVNNFVSFTLSNFYLDFTKDILYIEKEDALNRRSVQTVLYNVVTSLVSLLAPILPYTSEEVYSYMNEKEKSVHLESMPKVETFEGSDELLKDFDKFFQVPKMWVYHFLYSVHSYLHLYLILL